MNQNPAEHDHDGAASGSGFRLSDALWLVGAVVLAVGAIAGGWLLAGKRAPESSPLTESRPLAAFELQERSGRAVKRRELQGQFVVVNFMFTSCSVSCLAVNQHMAEIQKLTANQPDVRLMSITLDPRTDTPSVLTRFADRFSADTNRWIFLTGDKEAVYSLLESSFLKRTSGAAASLAPGGFEGMERIILVDPQGHSRASFNGLRADAPAAVVGLIEELRKQNPKP